MDFGIALATAAESWKTAQRAEELGFSHAWFYDTQMLSADCFVAMGAAAVNTRRIRLGTGVLVPSNRIAPVTANALATLNRLAPGRIDFGVGTGFTARRAMGFGPIKIKALETYLAQVYGLLRGEIVDFEMEGQARKIRFLNPELDLDQYARSHPLASIGLRPAHPCIGSSLSRRLDRLHQQCRRWHGEVEAMRREWRQAGHALDDLSATAFTLGCVLQEGEPADSARAMAQAGPRAAVMLHRAADEALSGLAPGTTMPVASRAELEGYIALARTYKPADAPYLQNHRGHLMFVKPEEKSFVTADIIRATSFTATEAELKQRIDALRAAGYTQFTVQLVPGQEAAIADWARISKAFA